MGTPLTLSSVPAATPYIQYVSSSGQTVFPYPFPITQDSDLVVVVNGVTQATDAGYTLSGQGNSLGGNVTFTIGETTGTIVTLFRNIVIQRVTQIGQNSGFSSTAFNAEYNNIYLILQQLQESIALSLQIPNTNNPAPATTLLPASYANKYLGFDAFGNPTPAVLTSSGSLTGSIIASLLNLVTTIAPTADKVRTPTEIALGILPVNYGLLPGNVKRYGAVGNNVADDTVAIQAAVSVGNASGTNVFLPVGTYKITAPIDFTTQSTTFPNIGFEFVGESILETIINANFTSSTKQAALSVNFGGPTALTAISSSPRVYPRFKNFSLVGINDAKTMGIFCNWTGSFATIQDVYVANFYNGVMVANDYNMKLTRVFSDLNVNNGFMFGYLVDGATAALCNNNCMENCFATTNGAVGIYFLNCRAMALVQCNAESNGFANIYLDTVRGGSLVGVYMEYSNALGGTPNSQLYMQNCDGITVNGLSVSSFQTSLNTPIINLANNNTGIVLAGLALENSPGLGLSLGITVQNSTAVSIRSSYFNNVTTAIQCGATSRTSLEDCTFSGCTTTVQTNNSANCALDWKMASTADITAASFGTASIVDIEYITGDEWKVQSYRAFNLTVAFSDLSAGAVKALIAHRLPGEQWRITDIFILGVVAFAGGGGNRNVQVTDATHVYTIVPSGSLTLNKQARWGSADVPFSATPSDMVQPTTIGHDLNVSYQGGTVDYTAGQINFTIVAQRVA